MSTRTVSIRIDESLLEAAGNAARSEGISRNAFIERAVLDRVRFCMSGVEIIQPGRVVRIWRTRPDQEQPALDDFGELWTILSEVADRLGLDDGEEA